MAGIKYPRTYHIPGSPGTTSDDRILDKEEWETYFAGSPVIATEKMDGENTTMTRAAVYARSLDSVAHESRTYVRALHGWLGHSIPEGWRVCGENLYARHSIAYDNLSDWFMVFAVYSPEHLLGWKDTINFTRERGLTLVPFLGAFPSGNQAVKALTGFDPEISEGFCLRTIGPSYITEHRHNVCKYVREKHVRTDKLWMYQEIVPNGRGPISGTDT